MSKRSRRGVLSSVALLAASSGGAVLAGEIQGQVRDEASGRALPNATVVIRELNRTVQADRAGEFRIVDVPAGTYTIEAGYVGFGGAQAQVTVGNEGVSEQTLVLSSVAEIQVVGYRLQQAQSLQDKKSSSVIKDSVSADEAGKLPDQNAGEALARLPGVSVTTDQGEGRYVTVRGIDATLNNVTLDGAILGSPEDVRRIALDTVPSNLLAKLEVIKAVTPDLDGNSIGATVNLVTPSAFDDPDGQSFSANAELGYYDLNEKVPYGGAVAFTKVFGPDDRWGVVLSASYLQRDFGSENLQGGDPWEEEGDFLVPDEFVLRDYNIERKRSGIVANLEFRPTDDIQLYWRNLYNEYRDTEIQPELVFDYRGGDLSDQTPTSGTFSEGEAQRINSRRVEIQKILSSTLGGEFRTGDWAITPAITLGATEQDTPFDREFVFQYDGGEGGDTLPMSYDTSRRLFRVTAPDEAYDSSLFFFEEAAVGGQVVEEDLLIGQLDFKRSFQMAERSGFVKFGGKVVNREKSSDQDLVVYDGYADDLTLADVDREGRSDFYSSEGGYPFGPQISIDLMNQFFNANSEMFEEDSDSTIAESFGVDFEIDEKVYAAYGMASIDIGKATIVGGVRVERTEVDYEAFDIQFVDGEDPEVTAMSDDKSYTDWLPGIQVRYALRENLLIRAAWTNTLGRPSYELNAPYRLFEIEEDDPDEFEGSIEAGNSDLEATESANYDLSIEWYTDSGGVVAAGFFYKDIDDPIFLRLQELEDVDFEGRFYTELELEQPQNAEEGEIFGIELSVQHQFRNLPSPFDGLGVGLSYTYSDAEATVFDRDDKLPFFLQSEHVSNAALFYEKAGLELRLAYAYRSEYLDTVGEDSDTDLYVDTHGQLDFKASYQFTDYLSGFLQFQNITDEPLRYFSGDKSRVAENEAYSWNMLAGVQVEF